MLGQRGISNLYIQAASRPHFPRIPGARQRILVHNRRGLTDRLLTITAWIPDTARRGRVCGNPRKSIVCRFGRKPALTWLLPRHIGGSVAAGRTAAERSRPLPQLHPHRQRQQAEHQKEQEEPGHGPVTTWSPVAGSGSGGRFVATSPSNTLSSPCAPLVPTTLMLK